MPQYPGDGGKVKKQNEKSIGGRGDKSMFKIRVSYLWVKQGGKRIKPGDPSGVTPKSEPAKVFIELGGAKSIVHDENWDNFVKAGLVVG